VHFGVVALRWLHLTGLTYAEIGVAALAQVVLSKRLNGRPALQVSPTLGGSKETP